MLRDCGGLSIFFRFFYFKNKETNVLKNYWHDRKLATVSYTYDNLDRVKTINYSGTNTTYGYNYSSDGSLAGIIKNGTLAYTYEYDSLGRLISSQRISNNRPMLYTLHEYDTSDRLLNQLWQVDGVGFYENYSYNSKDGTLKTMTVNGDVLNFQYNSLKQLAKRTSPKLDVEYTYCPNGTFSSNRIYEIKYRKHGETTYLLPRLTYAYDNAGNIEKVTSLNKTAVVYTYDSQN